MATLSLRDMCFSCSLVKIENIEKKEKKDSKGAIHAQFTAIFLTNLLWKSSLLLAAISKRIEQEGRGCTRSQDLES